MGSVAEIDPEIESLPAMPLAGTTVKRSISQLAFSFPVTLAVALIVLTVLAGRSPLNDPHPWWHLQTGEIIWDNHSIPPAGLFSFFTHNHAWTAHQWLF